MSMILDGTLGATFNDGSLQGAAASPNVLKNRIINGDFRIDQRNAGASVTPGSDAYTLDRWFSSRSQASKYTVQQNAGSVTPPTGFTNYLGVTSSSTYSVLAGDFFGQVHRIEGYNIADFDFGTASAKTITISFWVRSSLTGSFGASISNSAGNRFYPFSYTINSANTWEQKSITIAGDTSGTWLTTNGIGLTLFFSIGMGSNFSGTANAWTSSAIYQPTGSTSVVGTNGATFYITGVQLEQNTSATPFERRLYNQELANCQRYYFKNKAVDVNSLFGSGFNETTTTGYGMSYFPVPMRTNPTALEQTGTASDYRIRTAGATNTVCTGVPSLIATSTQIAWVEYAVASGLTAGQGCFPRANTDAAFLAWSAEL
jgi:hypothetical protein